MAGKRGVLSILMNSARLAIFLRGYPTLFSSLMSFVLKGTIKLLNLLPEFSHWIQHLGRTLPLPDVHARPNRDLMHL